jgi:hypothetical protein
MTVDDDSRIANALADIRAGAAAFDDANTKLYELLYEGERLQLHDEHRLTLARKCLNDGITVSGRAVEYLQRLGDQPA